MLYIETQSGEKIEWHLGDPIPSVSRVCKMQADGHELSMVLEAMRTAHISQR